MGQKFAILQKKQPKMIDMVFQGDDIRLLKLVGATSTEFSEGYTERYDHAPIPIEALKELAKHVNLKDL